MLSVISAQAIGALAVGTCGASGGSWNYADEVLAHGAALTNCPDSSCQVVATLHNNCAALAAGNNCAWAWVVREDSSTARLAAIGQCFNAGGGTGCVVKSLFCDGSAN
jgi:hypothetical protein